MSEQTDTSVEDTGSLETATNFFESMLDADGATDTPKKKPVQDEAEGDEPEDDEAEDTSDDADDTTEEDEADSEEEAPDDDEVDLTKTVTVKIDGKSVKVPLSEAVNGYQRQADYSRKTAELSQERQNFQAEISEVRQERAQYSTLLTALANQLDKAEAGEAIDWDDLRRNDPLEFAVKKAEQAERNERRNAIAQEQQRLSYIAQEEEKYARVLRNREEFSKLVDKQPTWKNPKVFEKVRGQIRDYALTIGFTPQEVSMTSDHRAILALYKAMQADKLVSKQATAEPVEKEPTAKKSPKPAPVGTVSKIPRASLKVKEASQRLAKSGTIADATKFFEAIL
jgi:hypothetical protein